MPKIVDLRGMRFGRLTVIEKSGKDTYGNSKWLCICDCGNKKSIVGRSLRCGDVKTCGRCKKKSNIIKKVKARTVKPKYEQDRIVKLSLLMGMARKHNKKIDCRQFKMICRLVDEINLGIAY